MHFNYQSRVRRLKRVQRKPSFEIQTSTTLRKSKAGNLNYGFHMLTIRYLFTTNKWGLNQKSIAIVFLVFQIKFTRTKYPKR